MNFDGIRSAISFFLPCTMEKRNNLEQKGVLDLPDEVIEDNIMVHLSCQDLSKLIGLGNRRLKDCSYRVMGKMPYSKYHQ